MMTLSEYMLHRLPVIEETLQYALAHMIPEGNHELEEMLAYHMGWVGEGAGPKASGKRLRPLLVLMSNEACGGEWKRAIPAASSLSFLHNFSLIHDDIEDNSDTRRGRPTVWKKWNMPQALNSGDLMFSFSYACMMRLADVGHAPETILRALTRLQNTISQLVHGQHLDMSFETRQDVTLKEYWQMINGKTAALISCACEIGALLAGAADTQQQYLAQFGRALGLAFQVQDDWLGIWGDPSVTGKSASMDLVTRKKTIPILYGLEQEKSFWHRWQMGFGPEDVESLAELLKDEGAQAYTEAEAQRLTGEALAALEKAFPVQNEHAENLRELAEKLTQRSS
ncbi:MAG: polyprenyl synthetase family protein [Anaerolineae bacterium]|jgi:geranylgeranyl diphosphate synthase type I|nr:polyprenyl synthetase family protein [Anaerolineae bacterium]